MTDEYRKRENLRKKLEAEGERLAINNCGEDDLSAQVDYRTGFRAALDLLWPAVEACEFYGDENNWMLTREDSLHTAKMTIIGDPDSYGYMDTGRLLIVGGKRAREALKKIGGEL